MLRTKVVCTLGPASSTEEIVRGLVRGGMNMARINMAHGDRETHRRTIDLVRATATETDLPIALLADLQGPKIRVGQLPEPVELVEGEEIVMTGGAPGPGEIPTTYEPLPREVEEGDRVLLDDGLMELECLAPGEERATFRVVRGGALKSNKGINVPGVAVRAPSLTEKDEADLEFALGMGVEYVGLSFVRRGADIAALKGKVGRRALVIAKIEKAQALHAMEEILHETDGVMVARGDLGVELPFERVPIAQKRIVQMANFFGRPVITATQMLESMIEQPRPTRAEASDVANAILDGTDAVMLSGETAVGKYPEKSLDAIVRIARDIEGSGVLAKGPHYLLDQEDRPRAGASPREHAVASATVDAVRHLSAPAIIVITRSGFSARLVSSYRPPVPIFAVCTEPRVYRQLTAVWGVRPCLSREEEVSYDGLTEFGQRCVLENGVGRPGQPVVVTAGFPFHTAGSTNTMRVEEL